MKTKRHSQKEVIKKKPCSVTSPEFYSRMTIRNYYCTQKLGFKTTEPFGAKWLTRNYQEVLKKKVVYFNNLPGHNFFIDKTIRV